MARKEAFGGPLQTTDAERWQEVKSALADALALSGTGRAAYLERLGARDPALRAEVESLLAADRAAGSRFLEEPAAAAAQMLRQSNRLDGRRLGPYELLDEIGAGGMGEVYRAVRVDGEYENQVAIKLVRAGVDAEFVGQRLRTERQILATFQHPNIARLLDGGTTDDGVPYLVMELIAGEPIDQYCDRHQLDIAARLQLFLPVCAAVQYAHQRAVIHRDLKPHNILVTADGVPKLLDFGIAKILEPGPAAARADVTISAGRMILTPEYASPEQLMSEPISAASDVYALGVILYELLTGAKPFRVSDRITEDGQVLRPVASDPARPSTVARRRGESGSSPPDSPDGITRRLRGDLDNIVLMALHYEPERRYATVERLADDIHRHLEHRPVSARRPTFRYRASVFVARHTAGVVAAALVFLALAAGYVATLREAHIANEQRALAQRRFDDVRRLADSLMFDIHDSIRDLPGAAPTRRLLIHTALQYLDGLSRDARGDPGLERDLAAAYLRLGDLQGQALQANEGDYTAALYSYRRALALWQASLLAQPVDAAARLDLVETYGKLSDLTWTMGDPTAALAYSRQTVTQSRILASRHPDDRRYQILSAVSALDSGYKLFKIQGDRAGSLLLVGQATRQLRSLLAAAPRDVVTARRLALAEERQAEILTAADGNDASALSLDQSALRVLQALTAAQPQNTDLLDLQAYAEFNLAGQLDRMQRFAEAERYGQAARAGFRSLSAADPKVGQYHIGAARALTVMAKTALDEGQPARARPLLQDSLQELSQAAPTQQASGDFRFAKAAAESLLGDVYRTLATSEPNSTRARLRDWRSAKQWYVRALDVPAGFADATAQATTDKSQILRCDQEIARSQSAIPIIK